MKQNNISENLKQWDRIPTYSQWMFHQYSDFIGKRILDIGAGVGTMMQYYIDGREIVVGIDIFEDQIMLLQQRFQGKNLQAFTFDIMEDDPARLKSYHFDTIICVNVLEHLYDDQLAICRMKELLEENGQIIIIVPAFQRLFSHMDTNAGHHRRYERGRLEKLAQENNLKIIKNKYFNILGIVLYYISGLLGERKQGETFSTGLKTWNSLIYNFASKIMQPIENYISVPAGLSEVIVLKKIEERRCNEGVEGNYYDKYASKNFIVKWLMRGFFDALDQCLSKITFSDVLEVGCGEGEVSKYIHHKYDCTIEGFDIGGEAIKKAKRNAPDIPFYVKSIYESGYGDHTKDLVVCCEVLEHLEDVKLALTELARISNGYILLSVPREPIWRVLNIARFRYLAQLGNTPGHINHWSKREFIKLVSAYGEIMAIENPLPWTIVLLKMK